MLLKRKALHLVILAPFIGCLLFWQSSKKITALPLALSACSDLPYLDVTIEGISYPFLLDLGSSIELSARKPIVEKIQKKRRLGKTSWMGIKGNVYHSSLYELKTLKMGTSTFKNVRLGMNVDGFILKDMKLHNLIETDQEILHQHPGSIGWPILEKTNLLLDWFNEKAYAVKEIGELKTNGYHIDQWHKIPFELAHGIIIEVATDFGIKRLILDTGATYTMVHSSKSNTYHSQKFILGGVDFGRTRIDMIKMPDAFRDIDGILGMNFLKQHIVYIDYKNKWLYLGKKQRTHASRDGSAEFNMALSESKNPLIQLKMQDQEYWVALSTGFPEELSLKQEIFQQLKSKTFNFNGLLLKNLRITEKAPDHEKLVSGFIGRNFLKKSNLLLDFKRGKGYATDSFQSLKKKGYAVKDWIQIPYEMTHLGMLVPVETDLGCRYFLIATNSPKTFSPNFGITHKFELASHNFGPKELYEYPAPWPVGFDEILGIDFFQDCVIYIDHLDEVLYMKLSVNSKQEGLMNLSHYLKIVIFGVFFPSV